MVLSWQEPISGGRGDEGILSSVLTSVKDRGFRVRKGGWNEEGGEDGRGKLTLMSRQARSAVLSATQDGASRGEAGPRERRCFSLGVSTFSFLVRYGAGWGAFFLFFSPWMIGAPALGRFCGSFSQKNSWSRLGPLLPRQRVRAIHTAEGLRQRAHSPGGDPHCGVFQKGSAREEWYWVGRRGISGAPFPPSSEIIIEVRYFFLFPKAVPFWNQS